MDNIKYFLGSNTADGFYSLYDGFVSLDEVFLWVLKGGAGCGKSSFMKKIGMAAESAGLTVEYAYCSGDPDSLDGLYIPKLNTAFVDGTAPHVSDPRLTAVDSSYIDLSRYYDIDSISAYSADLMALKKENSNSYDKAYAILKAAGSVRRGLVCGFAGKDEKAAADSRMKGIINREIGKKLGGEGNILRRFISSYTCYGRIVYSDILDAMCDKFYHLKSRIGLSWYSLQIVAHAASAAGYDIILCPDPLTPELPEALIIPALSLAFVIDEDLLPDSGKVRSINLDSKVDNSTLRRAGRDIKYCEKLTRQLVDKATQSFADAKHYHDLMEIIYNPFVDFGGVYSEADLHMERLGLK